MSGLTVVARGAKLYATGTVDGKRVRVSLELRVGQEAEAQVAVRKLEKELLGQSGPTWRDVAESYLRRPEGQSEGTVGYVRRLTEYWGDRPLEQIGTKEVGAWCDWLCGKGNKPGSVRREMLVMKAALTHGAGRGMVRELPKFPKIRVDDARDRVLGVNEVNAIREACQRVRPDVFPLLEFLMMTGARVGEALGLDWSEVDLVKMTVVLVSRKGGRVRKRMLPVHPGLAPILEAMRVMGGGVGAVFRARNGERLCYMGVRRRFQEVFQEAGVKDAKIHDMRRSFATHLLVEGVDPVSVSELLGHQSMQMLKRHYAKLRPAQMGGALAKLPY